jgi:hypothetical protein
MFEYLIIYKFQLDLNSSNFSESNFLFKMDECLSYKNFDKVIGYLRKERSFSDEVGVVVINIIKLGV